MDYKGTFVQVIAAVISSRRRSMMSLRIERATAAIEQVAEFPLAFYRSLAR